MYMGNTNTYEQYEKRLLFKFIKTCIFSLLGISNQVKNNFDIDTNYKEIECTNYAFTQNGNTYFGAKGKNFAFFIEENIKNNVNWCNKILEVFFKTIHCNSTLFSDDKTLLYYYDSTDQSKSYISLAKSYTSKYEKQLFDFIIERGIINWIVPSQKVPTLRIERLFSILENWSKKTYEGHNVCFGILLNTDFCKDSKVDEKVYSDSFLDFLEEEYSATLSDGISSMIEININCEFKGYVSLTNDDTIKECKLKDSVLPYRFAQIIKANVIKNKIGIFLLQNGDVIIAKNEKIIFIKRNGKWLNFQYSSFEKIVREKLLKKEGVIISKLLQHCFATCLDVSLSHTGGIIAIVDLDSKEENKERFYSIISKIDNLSSNITEEKLFNDEIKQNKKEVDFDGDEKRRKDLRKRITKRKMLLSLLDKYKHNANILYTKIDRKLRTELTGMDGASIVDINGNVIAFGAIIKNDAGSSGGGRGAAAKALSCFGGFAIKISTDGYIEVFVNKILIYSIK